MRKKRGRTVDFLEGTKMFGRRSQRKRSFPFQDGEEGTENGWENHLDPRARRHG